MDEDKRSAGSETLDPQSHVCLMEDNCLRSLWEKEV
jgi:hypothetical protein